MKWCLLICVGLLCLVAAFLGAQDKDRPVVSVLNFTTGNIPEGEVSVFADYVANHIIKTGKYGVIDRMQRNAVLEEIEFSQANCADETCQLEMGRLLSASHIIVGSIGKVGALYLVNMRLVEVETGESVRSIAERYGSIEAMIEDSERMAYQFVGETVGQQIILAEVQTAEGLIASGKEDILQRQLTWLKHGINEKHYAMWLEEKGFLTYVQQAGMVEQIKVAQEYIDETTTRGHAIDAQAFFGWYIPESIY